MKHTHCDLCRKDIENEAHDGSHIGDFKHCRISVHPEVEIYRAQGSPCWQKADVCSDCRKEVLKAYLSGSLSK